VLTIKIHQIAQSGGDRNWKKCRGLHKERLQQMTQCLGLVLEVAFETQIVKLCKSTLSLLNCRIVKWIANGRVLSCVYFPILRMLSQIRLKQIKEKELLK
jgi:hypothetical protein